MRSTVLASLAAACALTTGALAQDPITPQEFLLRLEGRTAWFSNDFGHVGVEHFHGDGTSTWLRADGTCSRGIITTPDTRVCFRYEDQPGIEWCWHTFDDDGTLTVLSADAFAEWQRIVRLSRSRLSCAPTGPGV